MKKAALSSGFFRYQVPLLRYNIKDDRRHGPRDHQTRKNECESTVETVSHVAAVFILVFFTHHNLLARVDRRV